MQDSITHEALEALSQKATQGTIEVLAPETEHDHGVPLIATDYPGTFGPSNGLVLWATMLPTEIDAEDTGRAEANAEFTAALWNAYRTGQLIHAVPSDYLTRAHAQIASGQSKENTELDSALIAQPSGDEVEAVARAMDPKAFLPFDPKIHVSPVNHCFVQKMWLKNATAAITALRGKPARKFSLGDRVTKTKGSSWTGLVVGFYSTSLTPIGYAVESENEPGSVQIYPESALEACLKARENGDG